MDVYSFNRMQHTSAYRKRQNVPTLCYALIGQLDLLEVITRLNCRASVLQLRGIAHRYTKEQCYWIRNVQCGKFRGENFCRDICNAR